MTLEEMVQGLAVVDAVHAIGHRLCPTRSLWDVEKAFLADQLAQISLRAQWDLLHRAGQTLSDADYQRLVEALMPPPDP